MKFYRKLSESYEILQVENKVKWVTVTMCDQILDYIHFKWPPAHASVNGVNPSFLCSIGSHLIYTPLSANSILTISNQPL